MASKGDKGYLEPQARRLYADGMSLKSIGDMLQVSVTSLARWKAETQDPGQECDEWDRARLQKRSINTRLRDLYEEQLEYMESLRPAERTPSMADLLTKMRSNVEHSDKVEKVHVLVDTAFPDGDKKKAITQDELLDVIKKVYGV